MYFKLNHTHTQTHTRKKRRKNYKKALLREEREREMRKVGGGKIKLNLKSLQLQHCDPQLCLYHFLSGIHWKTQNTFHNKGDHLTLPRISLVTQVLLGLSLQKALRMIGVARPP